MQKAKSVVVIGAGIAGLTAARALQAKGYHVKVLEATAHIGGRVGQRQVRGMTFNAGARLIYPFSRDFNDLLQELDLVDSMDSLCNLSARCDGADAHWQIELMPGWRTLVTAGLPLAERVRFLRFGWRMMRTKTYADPDDIASVPEADAQTLAAYVRQNLGAETLSRLIEPVFRATRGWQADQVSAVFLAATLPHLIGRRAVKVPRSGMAALPKALARDLDITCAAAVRSIKEQPNGVTVALEDGQVLSADFVVLAVQGNRAARLVTDLSCEDQAFLGQVRYAPYGALHLQMRGDLAPDMRFFAQGTGGPIATFEAIPRNPLTGSNAQIYAQLSPEAAERVQKTGATDRLEDVVMDKLRALMPGIDHRIHDHHSQWIDAMLPLFPPGYAAKMAEFRRRQAETQHRIYYCGDYLAQALVTGAAASGARAARQLSMDWSADG